MLISRLAILTWNPACLSWQRRRRSRYHAGPRKVFWTALCWRKLQSQSPQQAMLSSSSRFGRCTPTTSSISRGNDVSGTAKPCLSFLAPKVRNIWHPCNKGHNSERVQRPSMLSFQPDLTAACAAVCPVERAAWCPKGPKPCIGGALAAMLEEARATLAEA